MAICVRLVRDLEVTLCNGRLLTTIMIFYDQTRQTGRMQTSSPPPKLSYYVTLDVYSECCCNSVMSITGATVRGLSPFLLRRLCCSGK